jgi:malonyl-CoA O-methyltransferase
MSETEPEPAPTRSTLRPLDARALAHVQRRLLHAAQAPWLHGEVARRLAQRLEVIRLKPERLLDWGAFVGAGREHLARAYPGARMLAVEPDAQRRDTTAAGLRPPWWRAWQASAEVRTPDLVEAGRAQMLWSNMVLHGVIDPEALLQAWHRALEVDGFLMFSTLGPGTLQQLAGLYARLGWAPPMAPLVDMHDLGDMLVHAGFADPVMDQETVTLTWPGPNELLAELRQMGGNVDPRRHPGLRTPRWRQRLGAELQALAGADGRIALDFEIVYGHAFRAAPRARMAARTEVPLDDLRAMVRRGKRA